MSSSLIDRIATWNYVRGNTEYDRGREFTMLQEELDEYIDSYYMDNTAKELADIVFVAIGSLYKFTGSASKAEEILNIVCNHNDNKGLDKDSNGKVIKVKQPSCEPSIKKVLEAKTWEQGSLL